MADKNGTPRSKVSRRLWLVPPTSVALLAACIGLLMFWIGRLIYFLNRMGGLHLVSDTVGLIFSVVGVVLTGAALFVAIYTIPKFKRDLDDLREKSLKPLSESLEYGHDAQLHEKMAMMQIYLNTNFEVAANVWQIDRMLSDVKAAFSLKQTASSEQKKQWAITLLELVKHLKLQVRSKAKEIAELEFYQRQWEQLADR